MSFDLLFALGVFALVTSISPGPNNVMLMASGANFGFRRTIPHMMGIGIGFPAMIALIGLGIMRVFDLWPPAQMVLTVASALYLLWLAWKIARAAPPKNNPEAQGTPLGFFQAAAFQWVNPKAWSMGLSAITLYASDRSIAAVLTVALVYAMVSLVSTTTWTILGQSLRRVLQDPARLRLFNWSMAALLVATLVAVLLR